MIRHHLVLVQMQRNWLQLLFGPAAKDFLMTYVDVKALSLYVFSGLYISAQFAHCVEEMPRTPINAGS